VEHDDGNKFSRQKFRMYTKWWTAATFLLTRIYLCSNNGHYNNFNLVLIFSRYIWITFINIIHHKCIVLQVYFHPVSKWENVVALQGFKTKYQSPWSITVVASECYSKQDSCEQICWTWRNHVSFVD